MGLADADTAENGSDSKHIVITPVLCAVPNRNPGDPKLVGPIAGIRMEPGTALYSIYGGAEAVEEHFCNYEVNAEYVSRFEAAGLRLAAWGPQGELKAFELPTPSLFRGHAVPAAARTEAAASGGGGIPQGSRGVCTGSCGGASERLAGYAIAAFGWSRASALQNASINSLRL